jgi:hypothetical protein
MYRLLLGDRVDKIKKTDPMVDFLLVGAQKAGTTTLHAYLQEHPQIAMPERKELHFFNNETFFQGQADYAYYHSFFKKLGENKPQDPGQRPMLKGEATPAYLYCRDAAKRIWQYNPDMKIIMVLRNPIDRAFSHWNMEVSRNAETLSFTDAIENETTRCREALPLQHYVYSYLDRGFYTAQIREYWRFFPKSQVLILNYDELSSGPQKLLSAVFDFLGIDKKVANTMSEKKKQLHVTNYKEQMTHKQRHYLYLYYKYEIKQLEAMLDWHCDAWLMR